MQQRGVENTEGFMVSAGTKPQPSVVNSPMCGDTELLPSLHMSSQRWEQTSTTTETHKHTQSSVPDPSHPPCFPWTKIDQEGGC